MATPCSSALATKIALVVPSGGETDELLTSVLASEGWSIQRAVDNQHALDRAATEPFDLIITGRETLGREDVELLRKIRSARPHVRLIILTDKFTPGDVLSAMREGAFSYFSAPFQASELTEMVRAAMAAPCWDDGIEVLSGTPAWVRLAARCDIATANRLVQFLHGVKDPGIPEADREAVATAFQEILLNAMEHGGHFDPSQHVEISFVRMRRAVVCRVKDPGQGFSIEELRHAAINSPPDDPFGHLAVREAQGLRSGGFGLLLTKKLVDELILQRTWQRRTAYQVYRSGRFASRVVGGSGNPSGTSPVSSAESIAVSWPTIIGRLGRDPRVSIASSLGSTSGR